jgi:hypothetical protein
MSPKRVLDPTESGVFLSLPLQGITVVDLTAGRSYLLLVTVVPGTLFGVHLLPDGMELQTACFRIMFPEAGPAPCPSTNTSRVSEFASTPS